MSSVWSPPLTQARQLKHRLDEKRGEAAAAWNAFQKRRQEAIEAGELEKKATLAELNSLHTSYEALAKEAEALETELMKALDRGEVGVRGRVPGIADAVIKALPGGAASLKAITSVGVVTPPFWSDAITDLPGPLQWIRSLIPTKQAESDVVSYIRVTSQTNAATAVAAHAAKPESAMELSRIDSPVRVIAHVVSGIDRSLLADQSSLEDFLDVTMRRLVLEAEQAQILNGDGAGVNLRGILNTVGIGTVAKGGGESRAEAIRRAITTVQLAQLQPDAIAISPLDLQELRLEKDANGAFLLGPAGGPGAEGELDVLYGQLKVVSTTAVPEGTSLVGNFALGATIYEREEATVAISESHGDEFLKNEVSIRAEERVALAVARPAAFCSITGM